MKKIIIPIIGALMLSACSSTNQISITQSKYGNGIGISFGDGMNKEERAKADHLKKVIQDKVSHRKFIRDAEFGKRTVKPIDSKLNINENLHLDKIEVPNISNKVKLTNKVNYTVKKHSTSAVKAEAIENLNRKTFLKDARKVIKAKKRESKNSDEDDTLLVLVIIAIVLPPLAVLLHQGEMNEKFWTSVILTIFGIIPGIIYSLIVVLS